ncbi:MAG: SOS response-associated peptidase [Lachnospiraceae bacterium]
MCARYDFDDDSRERLEAFLTGLPAFSKKAAALGALRSFPSGEVRPADRAPVLAKGEHMGEIGLSFPTWGFPGVSKGLVINARAETAAEKPMFAAALAGNRCAIPAGAFFEWNREKEKVAFIREKAPLLFLAGIEKPDPLGTRFCILTTAANESVRPVHERMPLLLSGEQVLPWILDDGKSREILTQVPGPLSRRQDYEQLSLF